MAESDWVPIKQQESDWIPIDSDESSSDWVPVESEQTSAAEAFGTAAGQSLLFGFLDELKGGFSAAERVGAPSYTAFMPTALIETFRALPPEQIEEYKKYYKKYRDAERVHQAMLEDNHPVASVAGMAAGLIPQMMIPAGAAGRAVGLGRKVLTAAAVEAPLGALYGAGEAEEISDIPWEAAQQAGISSLAVAVFPVIGAGGRRIASKVGTKVADETFGHLKAVGQQVEERVAARLEQNAADEAVLQKVVLADDSSRLVGDKSRWAASAPREAVDELAARFPDDAAIEEMKRTATDQAYEVALAERKDFARFVLGRKASRMKPAELMDELNAWIAREGDEHAATAWKAHRESVTAERLMEERIINKVTDLPNSWIPEKARRLSMIFTDARYALNAIDRRWGTTTGRTLDSMAENYNKFMAVRDTMLSKLTTIRKELEPTGVYDLDDGVPILYRALGDNEYLARLPTEQQSAVGRMRSHYDELLDQSEKAGLRIERLEGGGYVPQFIKAPPRFIRAVRQRSRELGLGRIDEITQEMVDGLEKMAPEKFAELRQALRLVSGAQLRPVKDGPLDVAAIRRALLEAGDIRFVNARLESQAGQTFKRTGMVAPLFVREVDAVQLADRWAAQVYRHAFLRDDLIRIRAHSRWLRKAGDMNGAKYLDNWMADILGTRVDTIAGTAKQMVQNATIKLDDMIDSTSNPVAKAFYGGIKLIPEFLQMSTGVVYANLLGMNPRVVARNLTQPYFMTGTEIGGVYGQKLAVKAQMKAFDTTKVTYADLERLGLAPRKWTGEAVDTLEQTMSQRLPAKALRKYTTAAMWLYEKSDYRNRMVTYRFSQMLGDDLIGGARALASKSPLTSNQAAAVRWAGSVESGMKTRLRQLTKSGDQQGIKREVASYLNGKTQFHYNRISMSEYGRFMGGLFSMFSKWPLSISGHMGDLVLDRGLGRGMSAIGVKYIGPLVTMGVLDKFLLPDVHESDRAKLLIGAGGLRSWAPAQSAMGFVTGEFVTPPAIDAATKAVATIYKFNLDSLGSFLNQSFRYWVPGVSTAKLLFEDIPTLDTGENPKTITNFMRDIGD